tara:strand:- start:361 stop:690 length:330 start_codon:yes stop_codon:yes gene_type:complete
MKISKERLIEIIKEEIIRENEQELSTSDFKQAKTASAMQQQSKDAGKRIAGAGEITNVEQNIIAKMMDLLEIASVELDIDKGDAYTILIRAYKLIAKVVQNNREQQDEQ